MGQPNPAETSVDMCTTAARSDWLCPMLRHGLQEIDGWPIQLPGVVHAVLGTLRADGVRSRHRDFAHGGTAVTERRPAGMPFESWVERQIREAQERGEFDNLPGAGKPLPGLTGDYDEMWWLRQLAEREQISTLPPMLALRKEAEDLRDGLAGVPSEAAVRDLVVDYNARVAEAIRRPQDGPLFAIARPLAVDEVLAEWARRRARG
jgi:Domain of unknown function (DUF1992)